MKRQNTFQDWLDKWRVSSQLIDLVHKCFGLEHTPVQWYGHDASDDDATKYDDDDDNIHGTVHDFDSVHLIHGGFNVSSALK